MIGIFEQELYHMNDVCGSLELRKFSPRNTDTIIPDRAGWSNVRQLKKLSSLMSLNQVS